MKELLIEYLIVHNQVQEFKTWIIDEGIYTEGDIEAMVDDEIREAYLENLKVLNILLKTKGY